MIKLGIICPCYNEEEVIYESASKLESLIKSMDVSHDSFVVFVNDGSADHTWDIITELHNKNPLFRGVNLVFNSGHQNAIMAGMMYAKDKVDCAISIDVDLQDDINCIPRMIEKFKAGNDVVYGVKVDRSSDSVAKRSTANGYYRLQRLMGIDVVDNHADFRLVSNKVLNSLAAFKESHLYLRGIIPSLGFKSDIVEDRISERRAGRSKYSRKKMFKLATDGITSFSSVPLKIVFWIGVVSLIVALINAIDVIVALCNGTAAPGWSQLMLSVWFVGGMILIAIGLLGTYIGRIYGEVKNRPRYIISDKLD
ncbi:MAG: glycosyltransferase family 2 protein [Coriobacteriia bacterium]|nr:glycosyltransferase family 2 protein [Coriobacteriia bacterium]